MWKSMCIHSSCGHGFRDLFVILYPFAALLLCERCQVTTLVHKIIPPYNAALADANVKQMAEFDVLAAQK